MRLDLYLYKNALAKSRSYAKTLIDEGYVSVNGKTVTRPSVDISEGDDVKVTGKPYEYVSRGGLKLEAAIKCFTPKIAGRACVDIGASTGGFTDCLLKNGAERVIALDIGHGQLDKSLLEDSRVVNLEGVNARDLSVDIIGGKCDIAVSDISFISQTYVIPKIPAVLSEDGVYIALIKPQFECGKNGLGKNGIVKNKRIRYEAVKNVVDCAINSGLYVSDVIKSPIEGGDGNVEFLMYCHMLPQNNITIKEIEEVCEL